MFLRHNGYSPFESRGRRLSHKTIIEAHTIEKGLTLPKPKPHFGREKIKGLLKMNAGWTPPKEELSRSMLVGALSEYRKAFATEPAPDVSLTESIDGFLKTHSDSPSTGGVRHGMERRREENTSVVCFLESRFSAREFGQSALSDEDIIEVARIAQRAPSQCNRQSSRLHVYRNQAKVRELIGLQGGGRGFAENVPTLFVVTSEITGWAGPTQRNQPYMDGGLYAMMLLLALDAKGFLTCPLNLAVSHRTERAIKLAGNIPARERLIVMVAAGPQPGHPVRAAASPRWPPEAVCTCHD